MAYRNLWHSLCEFFLSILFLTIYSDKGVLSIYDSNSVNKSVTWTIQKIQLVHIKVLTSMVAFYGVFGNSDFCLITSIFLGCFFSLNHVRCWFSTKENDFFFVIWQFYIHFRYELVSFSPQNPLWSYHSSQDPSSPQVPLLVFSGIVTDSLFLLR